MGNDPRASRQFNPIKQARDYDPHGDYVRTWIVQLSDIPAAKVHTPWLLSDAEWNRHLARAAGKIGQDHKDAQLIPPSISDKNSRHVLSAEAVGRLGLADHTKGRGPAGKSAQTSSVQNGSDGDAPFSKQSNRWGGSSRSSLSVAGSTSTGEQTGPLRHEGYASESTGASSYSASDAGAADGDSNSNKKVNDRPPSHRSRSSGTTASGSENGSSTSNVNGNKILDKQITHRSASVLTKNLQEKDDFLSETPYPRTPLFEQESWKPHYNRKDYGRKKGGTGGGNSRRLIRAPPAGK